MRSSESFGQLAAALAKAQAALTNPEKSMTGTIRGEGHTREAQTFRYAPLSSGLKIIRKTLGQHEIATMQTTALDHATGMVSSDDDAGPFVGRVDRLGLAGVPDR